MKNANRIISSNSGEVAIFNAYALNDLEDYTVIYSIDTGYDPAITMIKCGDFIRVLNDGISEIEIDSLTSDSKTANSFEFTIGGIYRESNNTFIGKSLELDSTTFCHLMDEDEVVYSGTLDDIFEEYGNSLIRSWYRIVKGE